MSAGPGTAMLLQRVYHLYEWEPTEVCITGIDGPYSVFSHQDRRMGVKHQITPDTRYLLKDFGGYPGVILCGFQYRNPGSCQNRLKERLCLFKRKGFRKTLG